MEQMKGKPVRIFTGNLPLTPKPDLSILCSVFQPQAAQGTFFIINK